MKIHLRFDHQTDQHQHMTIFVSGKNCGKLCMSPAEANWFHHIIYNGCGGLSPKGQAEIAFVSSGKAPEATCEQIDSVVFKT